VTSWQTAVVEQSRLYSPIGLRLVDELTGQAPLGKTEAQLDILDSSGTWRQTDLQAVRTPSGVVAYPGLEFHADATSLLPRHYRVRLLADLYVPLYRRNSAGIEFDAYPYDAVHPPQVVVQMAQDAILTPAPNYPFSAHIPVLRGVVVDPAGNPVPDAVVTQGVSERVLTDSRGTFALPLRWAQQNVPVPIDAADERSGRVGTIQINLPGALGKSQKIPIS